VALASPERSVREASLRIIELMKQPCSVALQSGAAIFPLASKDSNYVSPSAQAVHRFMNSLISNKELLVVDAANLDGLLRDILGADSGDEDKGTGSLCISDV